MRENNCSTLTMAQSGQQFPVLFQNKTPFISVCFHPRHLATKTPALSLPTMIQSAKRSMWQRAQRSKVMPLTPWHSEVRPQCLVLCSGQAHIESVYPENSPLMELERWLFPEFPLRVCLLNIWDNLIMLSVANKNVDSLLCLKRFTGNLHIHCSSQMNVYIQIWYIMMSYMNNRKTNDVWHHWYVKCTIFEYTLPFKSLGSVRFSFFINEINAFIQQACIELIKGNSKCIYNTNDFYSK